MLDPLELHLKQAPAALDQRYLSLEIRRIFQSLAGIPHRAWTTVAEERLAIVHEPELLLDGIPIAQWRGKAGFLCRHQLRETLRRCDCYGFFEAATRLRGCADGQHPGGAARRADGAGIGAVVTGGYRAEDASLQGVQQCQIVRSSQVGLEAANRVVNDIHAVGDGIIDRSSEICGAAARTGFARLQPARLIDGNSGPRCDAADLAQPRAE